MALIDKEHKLLLNRGGLIKTFNSQADFDAWVAGLTAPEDIDNYIVIKNYEKVQGNITVKPAEMIIDGESFITYKVTPIPYFTMESDTEMTVTPRWRTEGTMEYSIDGEKTWIPITDNESTLSAKKVSFKGNLTKNTLFTGEDYFDNTWLFTGASNIKLSGDITTLLKPEGNVDQLDDFAFTDMFGTLVSYGAPIVDVSDLRLPSTKLSQFCYKNLFFKCNLLINSPELPAKELASNCYQNMFDGCASLKIAPNLPAENLIDACYKSMFSSTGLIEPPQIGAISLADSCFYAMFANCSALTKAPELPYLKLYPSCYSNMFSSCYSLTQFPKLPATVLAESCYSDMFARCGHLKTMDLPATVLAERCYFNMFNSCTSLVQAPKLPATELAPYCYSNIFNGCSVLIEAPELPAMTLASKCYLAMFYSCTSLKIAPKLPATTLVNGCYSNMFSRCTNLTTPPELPAGTLVPNCYDYMFNGAEKLSFAPKISNNGLNHSSASYMFFGVPLFSKTLTQTHTFAIKNVSESTIGGFTPVGDLFNNETIYAKVEP